MCSVKGHPAPSPAAWGAQGPPPLLLSVPFGCITPVFMKRGQLLAFAVPSGSGSKSSWCHQAGGLLCGRDLGPEVLLLGKPSLVTPSVSWEAEDCCRA